MRIHRAQISGIVKALNDTFNEGYYADKCLEKLFKANRKWGSRDRRTIAEGTYEIVRWWRRFNVALGADPKPNQKYTEDQLWRLCLTWLVATGQELPDWAKSYSLDVKKLAGKLEGPMQFSQWHSIPDWLNELGEAELGEKWPDYLQNLNQQAPVFLRVNFLKTTSEKLRKALENEEISAQEVEGVPGALKLDKRQNVFLTEAFKLGLFEVQDLGSQQIAPLLNPQPGDRVVDACAGAGGKTLQLAGLMKNKGKIIALDIHEHKLKEMRRRCARNGVDIVEAKVIDGNKTIKRMKNSCDCLLLDVPCTGLGVLRRNPDTKWKLSHARFLELLEIQQQIISGYSVMVKPGGRMVYATCSVLPSENEKQVQAFVKQHPEWTLEKEVNIAPTEEGSDGFYAARLIRGK